MTNTKITTLKTLTAALLLCLMGTGPALSAPDNGESPRGNQREIQAQTAGDRGRHAPRRHMALKRLANKVLTDEEQATLREARQQAMRDEQIQAALKDRPKTPQQRRELRELTRDKMVEINPDVEPLLDELRTAARDQRQNRRERRERFANLSREERRTLKDARAAARQDPQVREARENAKAAKAELREAIHEAMIQASPEVREILESLKPEDRDT
jgi:hypothetical protein